MLVVSQCHAAGENADKFNVMHYFPVSVGNQGLHRKIKSRYGISLRFLCAVIRLPFLRTVSPGPAKYLLRRTEPFLKTATSFSSLTAVTSFTVSDADDSSFLFAHLLQISDFTTKPHFNVI